MLTCTATVLGVNVWLFPFEVQHLVNLFFLKKKILFKELVSCVMEMLKCIFL